MAFVDIELDMEALARIGTAARAAVLETAAAVKTDILASQTMPRDTGTMEGTLDVSDQFCDSDTVHTILQTDGPQARRLYFHPEYNFQKVNNPNAGAGWYEPYTEGGAKEDFIPEAFSAYLKEHLK